MLFLILFLFIKNVFEKPQVGSNLVCQSFRELALTVYAWQRFTICLGRPPLIHSHDKVRVCRIALVRLVLLIMFYAILQCTETIPIFCSNLEWTTENSFFNLISISWEKCFLAPKLWLKYQTNLFVKFCNNTNYSKIICLPKTVPCWYIQVYQGSPKSHSALIFSLGQGHTCCHSKPYSYHLGPSKNRHNSS